MRLAASLGLAGLLLLTGCAPSALERPVVTEYGEFCGPGRPDLGDGTADQQIQRMRQIRPRDAIDAICRDHDLCVMRANNNVLDVECSRRMRHALMSLAASEPHMTARCQALTANFLSFFLIPEPIQRPGARNDLQALVDAVLDQPTSLANQAINGLTALPRLPQRLMVGWPDRFEPCFGLTAGRNGQDWEIPLAAPLGRAQPRIDGTWMLQRFPGGGLVFRPDWRLSPPPAGNGYTMMRDLPGGTVTVHVLFHTVRQAPFPIPPASLAGHLAETAREDVQGGAGEALLLDVVQIGGQQMVRYLFDGAAHDGRHRLGFATSWPPLSGSGSRLVTVYGLAPVATGPNGLLAIEEIAAGLRRL